MYPHSFLSTEHGGNYKLLQVFMHRKRPMDDMHLDLSARWEDEYATCIASGMSPYMSPVFPKRLDCYDRYMTFRDASAEEMAQWRSSLMMFLKKLALRHGRPLILKSPPHTCRIRLLLELFPDARFVHIHRNPIDVFRSTRHQVEVMLRWYGLQRFPPSQVDDWIIRRYREMYETFFEQRSLIPSGRYHDIAFGEIESDPIATIRTIYNALDLTGFDQVERRLCAYVGSLAGYRKNVFAGLPTDLRERIAQEWRVCFEEWGYTVSAPSEAKR